MRRLPTVAALLLTLGAGCAPEIPQEPQPDVVRALWNPTTGVVPTPTNLVRNNDVPQLDLPLDPELSDAELEFRRYLNSLDGYPLSSSITVPLSEPISEAGIGGSLVVLDVDASSNVAIDASLDAENSRLVATQRLDAENDGWQPGHTYVFGLRGYDGGVMGAAGEPVVADAPFFLIRSTEDLTDHPSAMPGESRHEKEETAEALEEVRQSFLPLYDALAQRGVPREEIAVASRFTTTGRPAFWFDADRRIVPVPNGLLVDPDTGLVDLPIDAEDDEKTTRIKEAISEYDGASTSGAITFQATGELDAATVNAQNVRLLKITDDGSVTEVIELEYGVLNDTTHGYVKPTLKLEHSTEYVLVGTRAVTSGGIPLEPQPVTALLRSSVPLVEDGASQVGSLDDETAALLEPWREVATPALDWLESQGTTRSDISIIAPFRTMSTVEALHEYRSALYEENVPTNVTNVVTNTPSDRGVGLLMDDVATVTSGTFEIRDYIDPRTKRWRADGPQSAQADFVLTIPESATPGEPVPVILFGHGLFTTRELVYFIADRMAEAGFAIFSFDLPYHGRRTVCLRDADCAGDGTCDEFGECSNGELAAISAPWADDDLQYPAATGSAFIEIGNIVGARDHFTQATIDMFQALRVIRGADWAGATGGHVLDGDDVVYLGMSLGGILGSIVAGAEPTIEDFVLNVPGGDFFVLFRDSVAFDTAFDEVLEDRMAPEGTDAYFELENALRWLLDRIDPINIASHALEPYTWVDPVDGMEKETPVKRVLIQMAEDDLVVPNSSTRSLSEAMGVPIREYTPEISAGLFFFDPNHAFLFDPTSPEGTRARDDAAEFFEARQ